MLFQKSTCCGCGPSCERPEVLETMTSLPVLDPPATHQQHQTTVIKTPTSFITRYRTHTHAHAHCPVNSDNPLLYYLFIFQISSYLWHFFFVFGSSLGDETFYALFFTFWFWNVDGAVGRRVILVWNLVMYLGQVKYF